jgi:hypothetical protein
MTRPESWGKVLTCPSRHATYKQHCGQPPGTWAAVHISAVLHKRRLLSRPSWEARIAGRGTRRPLCKSLQPNGVQAPPRQCPREHIAVTCAAPRCCDSLTPNTGYLISMTGTAVRCTRSGCVCVCVCVCVCGIQGGVV